MSNQVPIPPRPRILGGRQSFALVASQYNGDWVQQLVNQTTEELYRLSPSASIKLFQVPGAFEIPVIISELMEKQQFDVFIALGIVLHGETDHGRLIMQSVTSALQNLTITKRAPVIHQVLGVESEAQALDRIGGKYNRGAEAAAAAVEMANLVCHIRPGK